MTPPTRRRRILAVAGAVATLLIGVLALPRPPHLHPEATGDARLADAARATLAELPGPRDRLSVVLVEREGEETRVRSAHFGAGDDTAYEIGSVTKTLTGALLADAIARGEVALDTPLGDLLDLGDAPAASIALGDLATHTSGLPRLPLDAGVVLASIVAQWRAGDPYHEDLDALLRHARAASPRPAGEFEYSNLGMALLGHAVAAGAGTTYRELLDERVLAPLGMTESLLAETDADLPADALRGYTESGRRSAAWTLAGYAPAGGVRATPRDLARYVSALLDETAPGIAALDMLRDTGDGGRVGLAWFEDDGVTWHNGATGGFASYVGIDRAAGRGVVVLSSTSASVDALGRALLEGGAMIAWFPLVIGTAFAAIALAGAAAPRGPFAARSRVELVLAVLDAAVAVLLTHVLTAWSAIPVVLWLVPVALLALSVGAAVLRAPSLPLRRPERSARRTAVTTALHGAVLVALVVVVLA